MDLQVLPVVDDLGDDAPHVVGHAVVHGHDVAEGLASPVRRIAGPLARRQLLVVRRQIRQQFADLVEATLFVGSDEGGDAGGVGVAAGAAELLPAHLLPGHLAHDVGSGDEHIADALDHEREVGQRGE